MAGIIRTIIGNTKLRLAQQFHVLAGVDDTLNPQLLQVSSDGRLQVAPGGLKVPEHDKAVAAYFTGTNNLQTITFSLAGVTVATLTVAYVGGTPVADNARFLSAEMSYPNPVHP